MNKSYTSIEQSKKLAEFLPLESADGFWGYHDIWCSEGDEWEGYEDYPESEPYLEYTRKENEWKEDKSDIPCWSLSVLLSVLPKIGAEEPMIRKLYYANEPKERYICEYGLTNITNEYDNPIDACYEMIIKLHELNLL